MCVRPHLGSNKRPFTATKHRLCHTCSLSEVCEAACVFCLRPLLMNKWMQTTSVICFNLPLWSFTTTRWILRRSESNQTEKTTYGVWQQRTFRAHYLHVFIMLKYFILLARRAGCSYDTQHNMIPVESHFPTANTASRLSAPPDSLRGNKKKTCERVIWDNLFVPLCFNLISESWSTIMALHLAKICLWLSPSTSWMLRFSMTSSNILMFNKARW